MKWSSAVSSAARLDEAIAETASRVRRELGDTAPDLAVVFAAETFLHLVDHRLPGSTVVGGVASGARERGRNALFLDDVVHRDGLVGVALDGDVVIDTVVAQGCRPIGEPMFVTRCERNFIYEVDGRSPAAILSDLHRRASTRDKELFRSSLFLGIVMREQQQQYGQGDFLIRNVLALDAHAGARAV